MTETQSSIPVRKMTREQRRQYMRDLRARRKAEPKDPDDPRHGTENFYGWWGCRCDRCKLAHHEHCYGDGRDGYFKEYYKTVTKPKREAGV